MLRAPYYGMLFIQMALSGLPKLAVVGCLAGGGGQILRREWSKREAAGSGSTGSFGGRAIKCPPKLAVVD